jgi:hypothetical protein
MMFDTLIIIYRAEEAAMLAHGHAWVDQQDWGHGLSWLRTVALEIVKGDYPYSRFNQDWWQEHAEVGGGTQEVLM